MANNLEMAQLFQTKLDQQVAVASLTAYMEPNASQVVYTGGDTVKMPSLDVTTGLANYSRTEGYKQGDIDLKYESYKLTQDRGRAFQIDAMDVDESAFLATATNVMAEFQRKHVIPEIDAYRLAVIAGKAETGGYVTDGAAITDAQLLDALLDDLAAVEDRVGSTGLRVHMSATTRRRLAKSERAGSLFAPGIQGGNLRARLETINDAAVVVTPQRCLSTGITMSATDGWAPTVGKKRVNWLIVPEGKPMAVSKTDLPRIFDPITNQKANAWAIDYRKFHDIWVFKNQLGGFHVNTGEAIA